jgi:hypothetical protein
LSQFKRNLCALVVGALLVGYAVQPMRGQERRRPDEARTGDQNGSDASAAKPETQPIPNEKSSVTHHDLNLDGKTLHYTATASTMLIRDGEDDHPYGSIFSVAYTLDGADANTRPVTFLYNGGSHVGTLDQLREGELRGAIDGHEEVQLALGGAHLGQIDVEVADRIDSARTSSCLACCRLPPLAVG